MRGLLKLAYNSGQIKSLVVETVRENDHFEYEPTRADMPIVHRIDLRRKRGEVYAVYAIAKLMEGGVLHEVMTSEDVNRIRDRSDAYRAFKAGKTKSTPWSTDWSEMARKTVFRRLTKYLPSSSERSAMHEAAERIDGDFIDIDAEPITQTSAKPKPTKKRGAAAAALANAQAQAQNADEIPPDDFDQDTGELREDHDQSQGAGDDI